MREFGRPESAYGELSLNPVSASFCRSPRAAFRHLLQRAVPAAFASSSLELFSSECDTKRSKWLIYINASLSTATTARQWIGLGGHLALQCGQPFGQLGVDGGGARNERGGIDAASVPLNSAQLRQCPFWAELAPGEFQSGFQVI